MNKRTNQRLLSDSVGIWITEEPVIVTDNQHMIKESFEESIFLCEEDITDEEVMAMIKGQRYI